MTENEAIEILEERWRYSKTYKYTDAEIREAFDMAIKALEQQSCEDCISRQETISAIIDEYYPNAIAIDIVDTIANLPSVQPTRPTGKWKKYLDEGGFLQCECSNCGLITNEPDIYCPNCGARMEGE